MGLSLASTLAAAAATSTITTTLQFNVSLSVVSCLVMSCHVLSCLVMSYLVIVLSLLLHIISHVFTIHHCHLASVSHILSLKMSCHVLCRLYNGAHGARAPGPTPR